jgi:hypothetical protein
LFDGSGAAKIQRSAATALKPLPGKPLFLVIAMPPGLPVARFFAAFGIERAGTRRIMARADDLAGVAPMQDWLLVLTPMATVVYFLVHPGAFSAFMDWFARLLH